MSLTAIFVAIHWMCLSDKQMSLSDHKLIGDQLMCLPFVQ